VNRKSKPRRSARKVRPPLRSDDRIELKPKSKMRALSETSIVAEGRSRSKTQTIDELTSVPRDKSNVNLDPHRSQGRDGTIATYDYQDADGELRFQLIRSNPKGFSQRRPDPDHPGKWIANLKGVERIPYRLPELRSADPNDLVHVVEGEKDVDRLIAVGLVATCNPMGAGKWREEYSRELAGRDVIVIPDNDDAGRDHAEKVARSVAPYARTVRILNLPGLPPKGDVSDFLNDGGSVEELVRLALDARPFDPGALEPPAASTKPSSGPRTSRTGGRRRHDRAAVQDSMTPEDRIEVALKLGLRLVDDEPNDEGWLSCRAINREDMNPSASFNANSGVYIDHGPQGEKLSIFDLATKLRPDLYHDLAAAIDGLGDRFLGHGPPDRESGPLDIDRVRERIEEIVASRDLATLYKDVGLLSDLGRLQEVSPSDFAGVKARLGKVRGFRPRDLAAALSQHRSIGADAAEQAPQETDATRLIRLGTENIELYHEPGGKPFGRVAVDGHFENHPIRGPWFRNHLKYKFFEELGYTPSAETFRSTLDVLDLLAMKGPVHEVHLRMAELSDPENSGDPVFYLDLGDPEWRAVRVTKKGWKVVRKPRVRFRRPSGMLPLPIPLRGGSLEQLWKFANVRPRDRALFIAWLLAAIRPRGPFPVLILGGEQGTAKSTTSEVARRLIDPHITLLRSLSRDERDLMIGASNSWVLALDNLSHLTAEMSDILCRVSTGSGFSTRQLFTDEEEVHLSACRPILLNAIEDIASRGDLLDRAIVLELPQIEQERRMAEQEFWRAFVAAHPRLLGALLDLVVGAMARLPKIELDRLPRMADFARWAEAGSRAAGKKPGAFLKAYKANQALATELALESSPVAVAVLSLMCQLASWTGTAEKLLGVLEGRIDPSRRRKGWPYSPRGLSGALRRALPGLRAAGIVVTFSRGTGKARTRTITISREAGTAGTTKT
jgi:hypothetical protein